MANARPSTLQGAGVPSLGNRPVSYTSPDATGELTLGERIIVGATPLVTVGALIGLGYPPYAALTRWRICVSTQHTTVTCHRLIDWSILTSLFPFPLLLAYSAIILIMSRPQSERLT